MIPILLKGQKSQSIPIQVKDGFDYTNCTLHVTYQGVERDFSNLVAGNILYVDFTADEASGFELGTFKMFIEIKDSVGVTKRCPWGKVKVTDSPDEIRDAFVVVDPSGLAVPEVSTKDNLGSVKTAVNKILRYLKGMPLTSIAIMLSMGVSAAVTNLTVNTSLNDIPGDATIADIVAFGGVDGQSVTNIAESVVADRFVPTAFGKNYTVSLYDEEEESAFSLKFASAIDIFKIDGSYDDGAAFFMSDVYFNGSSAIRVDSNAVVSVSGNRTFGNYGIKSGTLSGEVFFNGNATFSANAKYDGVVSFWNEKDTSTLRKPSTGRGTMSVKPPESGIFANGLLYSPYAGKSNEVADYFLEFPRKDGTIAVTADIPTQAQLAEAAKTAAGQALNTIYDEELGVTWQAKMVSGNLYYIAVTNANISVVQ